MSGALAGWKHRKSAYPQSSDTYCVRMVHLLHGFNMRDIRRVRTGPAYSWSYYDERALESPHTRLSLIGITAII